MRIIEAYLRFEPVINSLLPTSRRNNSFCKDLRDVIAKEAGLGSDAAEEELVDYVHSAAERIRRFGPDTRAALLAGIKGTYCFLVSMISMIWFGLA